jgi:hypothetical protein
MKIIKVDCCEKCPYLQFSGERREYFYCDHKNGKVLASEREIVIKEASISPITMTVREQKKWTFVMDDEKTEWDSNKIDESCPLEDA